MSSGPPRIFDSQAYRQRRERAARLNGDIFLAQDVAGHVAERLGASATVATLIVDSGLRYLSTDVFR